MFDFMLEQPAVVEQVKVASAPELPQPACIYNCGTSRQMLLDYGTLMSERKQTYICWSCMNKFNLMTAEDRKRSGRE